VATNGNNRPDAKPARAAEFDLDHAPDLLGEMERLRAVPGAAARRPAAAGDVRTIAKVLWGDAPLGGSAEALAVFADALQNLVAR